MTFDLAAAAGAFGDELQQLLDAVLAYEESTDPELRQVTVTASRFVFAVELGTAKAKEAKTISLLHQGNKEAYSGRHYRSCETPAELQRSTVDQDR